MKTKILIVNMTQYGYWVDIYKYCEYLKHDFDVTHVGWDYNLPKVESPGVTNIYISRSGNKMVRYLKFLKSVNKCIYSNSFDIVFLEYFILSSIIKKLNRKTLFNLDIRTGWISKNIYKNYFLNAILRLESRTFRNITIISHNLAESLNIKKYHVLQLGGECFSTTSKSFAQLHLLYVGTLQYRNLIECVKGYHQYLLGFKNGNQTKPVFTIVGDSTDNELSEIRDYITEYSLERYIEAVGFVHNNKLHSYFEKANVGVSFIPITPYFDNQPPTKTYEYLLSGLPVIATKTKENVRIIDNRCGVLIEDNANSFCNGIKEILNRTNLLEATDIRCIYKENLWENVIHNNLQPYLVEILKKENMDL